MPQGPGQSAPSIHGVSVAGGGRNVGSRQLISRDREDATDQLWLAPKIRPKRIEARKKDSNMPAVLFAFQFHTWVYSRTDD